MKTITVLLGFACLSVANPVSSGAGSSCRFQPKYMLQNIFSTDIPKNESMYLNSGQGVYFIGSQAGRNKGKITTADNFYYNKVDQKFIRRYTTNSKEAAEMWKEIVYSSSLSPYMFNQVGKPGLKYADIKSNLLEKDSKVVAFAGKYYFVAKERARDLNILDPKTNTVTKLSFSFNFFGIRDMFLYDLDNDGNPEIFIFHEGYNTHQNIISCNIFSYRTQPAVVVTQ